MSIDEMRAEIKRIVDEIEDENLLRKILDILENIDPKPTLKDMYAKAVGQYGNTLRKLAQ